MARHFYRCLGCLEVVALDGDRLAMNYSATVATCDNCGQHFEHMGRVEKDRLVTDHIACKCDDRCTSARGPLCVCQCGGKHHGAGMLGGYFLQTTDAGPIPRVKLPSRARAIDAKRQFEEYQRLAKLIRLELGCLLDRRAAGEFLPRASFDRMRELQDANRKSWALRSHAGRLKTLRAVVKMVADNPIAAVAVAVTTAIQTAAPLADVPFSLSPPRAVRPAKQESLF